MRIETAKFAEAFSIKAQDLVRIPATVPHPFAQKKILTREIISIMNRVLESCQDLLFCFDRNAFVRIQIEYPWTGRSLRGKVFLFTHAWPRIGKNFTRKITCNLNG